MNNEFHIEMGGLEGCQNLLFSVVLRIFYYTPYQRKKRYFFSGGLTAADSIAHPTARASAGIR
jgi:hypothetical protein